MGFFLLKQGAEVQPQRWGQFVNRDHHTHARASLGGGRREGLAPIKDHLPHPCEHQRMDKEGGGRRTTVELGMLAFPQRYFLFVENQIQRRR